MPPNKNISLQGTNLGRCNPKGNVGGRSQGHSLPRCTCGPSMRALYSQRCSCTCHPCRGHCQSSPRGSDGTLRRSQGADRRHPHSHSHRCTPQGCVLKSTNMSHGRCSLLDTLGLGNSRLSNLEDTGKSLRRILRGHTAAGKPDAGRRPQGCFLAKCPSPGSMRKCQIHKCRDHGSFCPSDGSQGNAGCRTHPHQREVHTRSGQSASCKCRGLNRVLPRRKPVLGVQLQLALSHLCWRRRGCACPARSREVRWRHSGHGRRAMLRRQGPKHPSCSCSAREAAMPRVLS